MRARIPAVVAVVGVLLVGGATTGTTLASWRDQAGAGAGTARSGTFVFNVNGGGTSTTISLGTLPALGANAGATAGDPRHQTATLNYTVTGKNNTMRLALATVTASHPDFVNGLEVAASAVASSATCPTPAGTYQRVSSWTAEALGDVTPSAGSRKLCLSTRVRGGAPPGIVGRSGSLSLTLTATQVRP